MTNEGSGISGKPWCLVIATVVVALPAYPLVGCGGETPPADAASEMQLSFEHYQAGRYQEAITAAEAALAADPNLAQAYNNIAVSYLGLRMFDEATKAAQEALRLSPDLQLAKNNLAWIQREKAKAPGVPPVQAPAPGSVGDLLNQSVRHAQTGRFKECIDTARQAIQLDPNSAPAFTNVGFCAASLQQWDEGIRNTQESIRLDPTFQRAKNNLAWMQGERLKAGAAKAR